MKPLSLLLLLAVSSLVNAADRSADFSSLPSCYKGARFTEAWMTANTRPREILVRALKSRLADRYLELKDEYTDSHIEGNSLYVLTLSDIEHWDLNSATRSRVIQTHSSAQADYPPYYSARGFGFRDGRIFVAHERFGVSVIDQASGKFLASIDLPGEAMDLTFAADQGYVLSESVELSGSEILGAIFAFDPASLRVTRKTLLQGAPDGALELVDGAFYIGSHFYWKVARAKVDKARLVSQQDQLIIPEGYAHGKPFIDAQNIYSCGETGSPVITRRN